MDLLNEKHELDILLSKDNNSDRSSSVLDIDSSYHLNKQIKNGSEEIDNINDCSINSNESYDYNFEELLEDYKRKEVSLLDRLLINEEFDNYQDIILDIKKI